MPMLDRDGVNIHYEVAGDGPALILTHGYSATGEMWAGQLPALTPNFTVITWDMRGHGRSDYPEDQSVYSEEATVADMAALLRQGEVMDTPSDQQGNAATIASFLTALPIPSAS